MSRDDIPEPWRSALERKGIDSIRRLASKAEISPMTASRLVKDQGTSVETVNAVARLVFDNDVELVWRLRGLSVRDLGPFELPVEASLLTDDQREAVVAVVRAMLPADVKAGITGAKPRPRQAAPGRRLDVEDRRALEQVERERGQQTVRRRAPRRRQPTADVEAEAQTDEQAGG